jgi:uncharacterized protein DUF4288
MATVFLGLENFNLIPSAFFRLRNRTATIRVYLKNRDINAQIVSLEPNKRRLYQAIRWKRWSAQLQKTFPAATFTPDSPSGPPSSLATTLSIREIKRLVDLPCVHSILVKHISGYTRRRKLQHPLSWFCLRALVAIQIEGQTHGNQSIEDRFVIVRALSAKDAKRCLQSEWLDYATPYLNSDSRLVRWNLEKVVDVYEMIGDEINPKGTEVYSRLRSRRMKPAYQWQPRRSSRRYKK